jgi:hypothetical protein
MDAPSNPGTIFFVANSFQIQPFHKGENPGTVKASFYNTCSHQGSTWPIGINLTCL